MTLKDEYEAGFQSISYDFSIVGCIELRRTYDKGQMISYYSAK